jgi:putative salt-induced outer membrane protein YdiY
MNKLSLAITSILLGGVGLATAATNKWETSAAAGLTLTRGNSETALGVITVNSTRKWEPHEVLLGAQGTYGESTDQETDDTDKTASSISAFGQYNKSISERWYAGVRLDFLHDDIADVSYRFTLSPLIGYYAIKQPNTTLKFEAGPAGVAERVGGISDEFVALRLGERFEHKFSPKARVWQSFEILPQVDRLHNYIINAEIGAEASLTEKLSLRGVVQDTYDNRPADSDKGGDARKKNDIKIIMSLAYKF